MVPIGGTLLVEEAQGMQEFVDDCVETEAARIYFIVLQIKLLNAIQEPNVGETAPVLGGNVYVVLLIGCRFLES